MKKIKKLLAITMAAILTVSIGIVSLAAGEDHTVTIKNETTGHTYEAYQIFSGDLSENKTTLSNIDWGNGVDGDALLDALKETDADTYGSCEDAADVAEILSKNKEFDNDQAKAFAEIAAGHLNSEGKKTSSYSDASKNYTITGLDDGYYLIKDGTAVTGTDAHTEYILKVTDDTPIDPKSDVPESYKKVKDINDSEMTGYTDWQDSADYDIGDPIPFQLTATLPDNYSEYNTYTMTFHDTEAQGLEFDKNSVEVYVGDNPDPISTDLYSIEENPDDDCTFEIVIANVKNISGITDSSVIRVEYKSQLTDRAKIGSEGNKNTMYLTYSNNPYGEGTGTTATDTVIVFTYQTIINKKNENQESLPGAEFKLEKQTGSDTWTEISRKTFNDDKTMFIFTGLDDGNYRLTETTTPDGYNTMDPVTFTVTATHDTDTNKDGICDLTALSGDSDEGKITFSPILNEGSLSADVINVAGTILPSTGGIGTAVFYGAGVILIAGAAVLITVRVRKSRR